MFEFSRYQVYAYDITDKNQRDELNALLKKYPLSQPIDKRILDDGRCIVFCQLEIMPEKEDDGIIRPKIEENGKVPDLKPKVVHTPSDQVYEESPDTKPNKIFKEVKQDETP